MNFKNHKFNYLYWEKSGETMKPNILFILVDSFRADKFFGDNKSSKTPNIDFLVKNGAYFKQAITSADGTILSWASIFTGQHPFKTGIRSEKLQKINPEVKTYYDILKSYGYHFYAQLPTVSKTSGIFPDFKNKNYTFDYYLGLSAGLGSKILDMFESQMNSPWFTYLHIEDLHFPIIVPSQFNDEKYGITNYDKAVSHLDFWIGKILRKINLEKTLLIFTADHGAYLSSITHNGKQISLEVNASLQTTTRNVGNLIPKKLRPIKSKVFFLMEKIRKRRRIAKLKNLNLKPHEERGLLWQRSDLDHFLFDDRIHVPLLFSGYGIKKGHLISQQVRTIDIFPTISEIIDLPSRDNEIDGRSVLLLIEGKNMKELPQYIESTPLLIEIQTNDFIGVRTSKFKYFRDKNNPKNRVHLYDLKKDPFEDNNIASNNPELINEMEKILKEIINNTLTKAENQLNEEETERIEDELRKLGYL